MQQTPASEASPTRHALTIPFDRANRTALLLSPILAGIFIAPHILLWGFDRLLGWVYGAAPVSFLFVPALVVSFFLHEALHGMGFFWLGRIPLREITIGFAPQILSPYIHSPTPLRASAYRASLLLPGLMLGIIPGVAGIWTGAGWLTLYGLAMTVAALGDAQVAWLMRRIPGHARVVDHPQQIGCEVLGE